MTPFPTASHSRFKLACCYTFIGHQWDFGALGDRASPLRERCKILKTLWPKTLNGAPLRQRIAYRCVLVWSILFAWKPFYDLAFSADVLSPFINLAHACAAAAEPKPQPPIVPPPLDFILIEQQHQKYLM